MSRPPPTTNTSISGATSTTIFGADGAASMAIFGMDGAALTGVAFRDGSFPTKIPSEPSQVRCGPPWYPFHRHDGPSPKVSSSLAEVPRGWLTPPLASMMVATPPSASTTVTTPPPALPLLSSAYDNFIYGEEDRREDDTWNPPVILWENGFC